MIDNINTYATDCLRKDGNVDRTVNKFAEVFDTLPEEYNSLKPIMLHTICTFLVNSPNISWEMRSLLTEYSFLLCRGPDDNTESMFHFLT